MELYRFHILTLVYESKADVITATYSDAQKRQLPAIKKNAYDRIEVVVPKGHQEVIKAFAASQGKSLNRFICDAIEFQMKQAEQNKK